MEITLSNKSLLTVFIICLFFTLTGPLFFPQMRLVFFTPFLVISWYQKKYYTSLWYAVICGVVVDLLCAYTRLGLYPLNFCFSVGILYRQRRNFFADSLTTLPIMTFLFSSCSTLIMACLLYGIEMRNVFSWEWLFTDILMMSVANMIFTYCFFVIPAIILGKRRRRGKDYFLSN